MSDINKSFLLKTAFLNKLTPEIANNLTGIENSDKILKSFYKSYRRKDFKLNYTTYL